MTAVIEKERKNKVKGVIRAAVSIVKSPESRETLALCGPTYLPVLSLIVRTMFCLWKPRSLWQRHYGGNVKVQRNLQHHLSDKLPEVR